MARNSGCRLGNRGSAPSPQSPRDVFAADNGTNCLPDAPFDYRSPGNEAEAEPVVQHREAATCEQDGTPIDARRRGAVGERAIRKSGFGGNRVCCGFAVAEFSQQVACEDNALTPTLGEALLD